MPSCPTPSNSPAKKFDALLKPCGWDVQDKRVANLAAARGVAVRELTFRTGEPDYTLFVDGKAIGTIEAKPAGHSLTGVEEESEPGRRGPSSAGLSRNVLFKRLIADLAWLINYTQL